MGYSITIEPEHQKRPQDYRLFDHVTVAIQLSDSSDVHARSLILHLLAKHFMTSKRNKPKENKSLRNSDTGEMNFYRELNKCKNRENSETNEIVSENCVESKSKCKKKICVYKFFEE